MGFELTAQFKDISWYYNHREQIKTDICQLSSFVSKNNENEFWLKDISYGNQWDFDVRIFLKEQNLLIEVSAFSKAFTNDIRKLYEQLIIKTQVILTDDDMDIFSF